MRFKTYLQFSLAAFIIATIPVPADGRSLLQILRLASSAPRITTSLLPPGTVNAPYSFTLAGTGGKTPYKWYAGGLPAGLSRSGATIIGTVRTATIPNQPVQITLVDKRGYSATVTLPLAICAQLIISPQAIPSGKVGQPFRMQLKATGGVASLSPPSCNP